MNIAGAAAALALASAGAAAAQTCDTDPDAPDALALARVQPARAVFLHGGPRCPADPSVCRPGRAYVVAGDRVLTGARAGRLTCGLFVDPRGRPYGGWLPTAELAPLTLPPPGLRDWAGSWRREEAQIDIEPGAAGRLRVEGEATWGAGDPERVKRGAVNTGDISSDMAPEGDRLAFGMSEIENDPHVVRTVGKGDGAVGVLPYRAGVSEGCYVRMRLIGPYLAVVDNGGCGGVNVSFGGVYARGAPAR